LRFPAHDGRPDREAPTVIRNVTDRSIRSLIALEQSASTARVLNLVATHRRLPGDETLEAQPFFQNKLLNHGLVVKHRVRPHEQELFYRPVATVTKVMAPIDGNDLRCGARYLMMGQKDFDQAAEAMFGDLLKPGAPDRVVLDLINELPSLDPFLLKEHLRRNGFEPARGYFSITDADIARMYDFVRQEVMALVTLSSGPQGGAAASKLVDKLLSNSVDDSFEPLKATLRLNDKDYQDGVFCWRGFLYYKWVLAELTPQLGGVMAELSAIRARGPNTPDTSRYLPEAKERLQATVLKTVESVNEMLGVYDKAYRGLTQDGQPTGFRDFLLAAPAMFMALGEQTGAVQHIVSFWRYRFPPRKPAMVSPEELMDIFMDFEDSLVFLQEPETAHAAVLNVA
jgi:hypothetical protein